MSTPSFAQRVFDRLLRDGAAPGALVHVRDFTRSRDNRTVSRYSGALSNLAHYGILERTQEWYYPFQQRGRPLRIYRVTRRLNPNNRPTRGSVGLGNTRNKKPTRQRQAAPQGRRRKEVLRELSKALRHMARLVDEVAKL